MAKISRGEILRRARLWPLSTVSYSQSAIHTATGYRQDCSGYISMCWGIPPNAQPGGWGGLNTVTLVTGGYMSPIPASALLPGDAVAIAGPNTQGNAGHIVLFEKWDTTTPTPRTHYFLYEQAGGTKGPIHRRVAYPYPGYSASTTTPWRAYRFRDVDDSIPLPTAPTTTPGGTTTMNWDGIKEVVLDNVWDGKSERLADVLGRTLGLARGAADTSIAILGHVVAIKEKLDSIATASSTPPAPPATPVDTKELAKEIVDEFLRRVGYEQL